MSVRVFVCVCECLHILSFKRLLELELIKRQSDLNTELEVRCSSWNANECRIRF